jgi:hypothetical protein
VPPARAWDAAPRGIRLAVLDDNPHVEWQGRVHPRNATFHRFLAALLDVDGGPVARIDHLVPLQRGTEQPRTLPLDPRLHVVGTAPFEGIAGYLRRAPLLLARNASRLRGPIAAADLLWLKLPASNAPLAGAIAALSGTPRFGYVAGSAARVAAGQQRGPVAALAARAVGVAWDALGRLAVAGGRSLVVGEGLLEGRGVVTSLLEPDELRPPEHPWRPQAERLRLCWAGRLAPGKGLETLLDATARLAAAEPGPELLVLGDGPSRPALEARAGDLGLAGRIEWRGHVADRTEFMAALAGADLFCFPSPAEGFPKVVLEAMAVGVPVVATASGSLAALVDGGLIEPSDSDPEAVAAGVRRLVGSPERVESMRRAAYALAARHTRPLEAARLVAIWRETYPSLRWP